MAFLGLRLGGSSSAGTVQNYSPHGCFGCGCGKGRNYGRFGTKFGAKSSNSSLLQGEQRQESGKKFRKILPQIDRKLTFFHPKWSQNGVWAPSGAKMGPGREKMCKTHIYSTHLGGHFGAFGPPFSMPFFNVFLEGLFFASWATFGRTWSQKGAKREPKWRPKRAWGHPLGSVKSMAGAMFAAHEGVSGRVREATFSRLGLQTHSGGVLGSILADFKRFGVPFGVHFGSIVDLKRRLFSGPNFRHFLGDFWEGPAAGADLIWGLSRVPAEKAGRVV